MTSERNKAAKAFDILSWFVMVSCVFLLFAPGKPGYAAVARYVRSAARERVLAKHFPDLAGNSTIVTPNRQPKLVEFADYECPYCLKALSVIDSFVALRPDNGVGFRYVVLPGHSKALPAAKLAICLEKQRILPQYHRKLFEITQSARDGRELTDQISNSIRDTGIANSVKRCALDDGSADERLKADAKWAEEIGLTGTPTFVGPHGVITGVPTLKELIAITGS